jgi:hypothetical protein
MPIYDKNIGNISKGNDSILQTRSKFRNTSYNIHKEKTW